ncbi:glycosyltransferase family 4 protein [Atrimonas thermophila]|uniref:glycosyltransferase family 4 protein n=1 Tax=Atrimonas thermophila TaxID=3064161 RepID=UPI00399CE9EF
MNIWIFNHYAITPDLPGGTRHYDLSKELVKRGHRVTIFASDFVHYIYKYHRTTPSKKVVEENVDGIQWVWIRTFPYAGNNQRRIANMIDFGWRVFWVAFRRRERPDIVIGSSPHLFTPLAAYLVARRFRVPFMMEVRDLWPQVFIDIGRLREQSIVTRLLRLLEKFLYERAKRIIILGTQMQEKIAACGISKDKISWIPNGTDLSRFKSTACDFSDGDEFKVMYIGAHGPTNALDTLIEAASIIQKLGLSKIKFVLVGDGPEKQKLMGLSNQLGLSNVEFRNPVPKTKIPEVLSKADVLVATYEVSFSSSGGSLNKLNDYMAVGKPVVLAVETAYNPVEKAKCGFTVPPRNSQALADAIMELYEMSPEDRKIMGERGRQYVEEFHDVRRLADKLEQMITGIA